MNLDIIWRSAIVHWLSLFFKLSPPGNFFFIMMASTAGSLPFDIHQIPDRIGLITMGTIFACLMALVYSLVRRKPDILKDTANIGREVSVKRYTDYIEALIVGCFMFCSILIGHLLELRNPYWVPISCIAVMQGATASHIWRRGLYRVLGTIMGMGLCWVILSTVREPLLICLTIAALQFIIEATVTRNYALAVVFITPLTILLFEAANPIAQNPTELIATRLLDVLIGSLIGALGGWFMYNEKLRHRATRRMRITKTLIRRKR